MKRLLSKAAIVIGALYFGAPVTLGHATAITTSSDLLVTFAGSGNGVNGTATAELGDFVFSGNTVTFKMDVTNTTGSATDARFTALGWVTTPATTAATDNTGIFATATNVGLGPANLSICFVGGTNCNGGSNGGLEDPANSGLHGDPTTTGIFNVTITFAAMVPPLDFSSFDSKFQTADGSFFATGTVANCVTGCVINPLLPASEPAAISILGVGVLGTLLVRNRIRRRAANRRTLDQTQALLA